MAMLSDTTWEIQTGGSDLNGGGFVTSAAGTNYSLNATKNVATGTDDSTTDVVTNGTTTITSATANFGATSCLGNVIYLSGGTGAVAAARYRIVTRTSATAVVLDRATGLTAGTGVTMNIGGALATPAYAFHATQVIPVTGNKFFIKAGTYTVSTGTANVSNGTISTSLPVYIEGYQTTRGDFGTKPILQASGITAFTMITLASGANVFVVNITCDGAGLSTSRGFNLGGSSGAVAWHCHAANCTNNGFLSNSLGSWYLFCSATGCSAQPAINVVNCFGCVAYSNTVTGFAGATGTRIGIYNSIAYNNSGASSDGFICSGNQANIVNCVAYNNGRDGFRAGTVQQFWMNCIAEGQTAGIGFNNNADPAGLVYQNCAGFDNSGGDIDLSTGAFCFNLGFITGSSSFFTNAAAGDFSLNTSAGGGALARAAGLPGLMPPGLTTGFLDVGAVQHQDTGGGGGGEHSAVF